LKAFNWYVPETLIPPWLNHGDEGRRRDLKEQDSRGSWLGAAHAQAVGANVCE
jgi:hypothetical protein